MPLIGPARLGLLAFPQRWEPDSLTLRFLCLPKGNPLAAPLAGQPPFATARLVFEASVIPGLERLPVRSMRPASASCCSMTRR